MPTRSPIETGEQFAARAAEVRAIVESFLTDCYGDRCKDFCAGCPNCEAFALLDKLLESPWERRMKTLRLKPEPFRDDEREDIMTIRDWIAEDLDATADDETIRTLWRAYSRWAMCAGWLPPNQFDDRLRFAIFCREEGVIE